MPRKVYERDDDLDDDYDYYDDYSDYDGGDGAEYHGELPYPFIWSVGFGFLLALELRTVLLEAVGALEICCAASFWVHCPIKLHDFLRAALQSLTVDFVFSSCCVHLDFVFL